MAIQFVGSVSGGAITAVSSYALSLTSLSGGIGSAPINGDLILVLSGWSSVSDGNPGVVTPTATELADIYANNTADANLSAAYFFAGSSPPTSLTVSAANDANYSNEALVLVFRGVDPSTPIDATTTTATGGGSGDADPPSITPATNGACIVAGGLYAGGGSIPETTMATPTGFTSAGNPSHVAGGRVSSLLGAYKLNNSSGVAVDPSVMTASNGGTGASWAAVTIALRAAPGGNIKTWNGSAWVTKPVKVWNGSAWVAKPLKRWNGSAWVTTNY